MENIINIVTLLSVIGGAILTVAKAVGIERENRFWRALEAAVAAAEAWRVQEGRATGATPSKQASGSKVLEVFYQQAPDLPIPTQAQIDAVVAKLPPTRLRLPALRNEKGQFVPQKN